jgi:hypothetical protein
MVKAILRGEWDSDILKNSWMDRARALCKENVGSKLVLTPGAVAATLSPPGYGHNGVEFGPGLYKAHTAYCRTSPPVENPNVDHVYRSLVMLSGFAVMLINKARRVKLSTDKEALVTISAFLQKKLDAGHPSLQEALINTIRGRWALSQGTGGQDVEEDEEGLTEEEHGTIALQQGNQQQTATAMMTTETSDNATGKLNSSGNRKLSGNGSHHFSISEYRNGEVNCTECDNSYNIVANHVCNMQCMRCGGYILQCEADKIKRSSSSSPVYHSNIETCLFQLSLINLHQKRELTEQQR